MMFRYVGSRHPMQQLRREMDRLLSGFAENLGHVAEGAWSLASRGQPAVNMWESGEAVSVELEVPGLKSDQVEISVSGDELSLSLSREDAEQEGLKYHRRERPVGSFHRVVRLPSEVDAERVDAEMKHGVLTITLPKAEAARPRKISVSVGD
jgi:HSP20 family protein